jgi:Spy/CpxP family protein refolding chaperone
MRTCLASTVVLWLFAALMYTPAVAQPAPQSTGVSPATMDEVLTAVRADLQNERADIIAKNVSLTSDQAAKFWPLYQSYQKEQNAIMDEQLKAIQRFIETFDSLDDSSALALINGHFDRDTRMTELRKKWLPQFQQTLGTKLAVRVMQIDRRLSLMHQLQFASKIPLAH